MIGTSDGYQFENDAHYQLALLQQPKQPDVNQNGLSDMKGDIEFRRFIDQARPPRESPVWRPGTQVPDPSGLGRNVVVS